MEFTIAFHVCLSPSQICFAPSAASFKSPVNTPLKNFPNPSMIFFRPSMSSSPCPVKETSATRAATNPAIRSGIQLPVRSEMPIPAASSPAMIVSVFTKLNPFSMTSLIPTTSIARPPTTSAMPAAIGPNAIASPAASAASPASIPRKFCKSIPFFHASSQKYTSANAPAAASAIPAILLKSFVNMLAIFQASSPAAIAPTRPRISWSLSSAMSRFEKSGAISVDAAPPAPPPPPDA